MSEQHPLGRLSDADLWRCVDATLSEIVLPAISDDEAWARAATVQLIGLVRYAARRPDDPTVAQLDELAAALRSLSDNPLVTWDGTPEPATLLAAAGTALAAAVTDDGPAGDEIRRVLRPVVVRHLDDELEITGPLVAAFRGVLDG